MSRVRALARAREAARLEAEVATSVHRLMEEAFRYRDSAVGAGQQLWRSVKDAEAAKDRVKEEAEHAAACVVELEAALANQASAHNRAIDALTTERDGLRTQVGEVREGNVFLPVVCQ